MELNLPRYFYANFLCSRWQLPNYIRGICESDKPLNQLEHPCSCQRDLVFLTKLAILCQMEMLLWVMACKHYATESSKCATGTRDHWHELQGTFEAIELPLAILDGIQRAVFTGSTLRENRGFKELWAIGFSPEDVPAWHRRARFEWINKSQ
jgi:hypothetical protein